MNCHCEPANKAGDFDELSRVVAIWDLQTDEIASLVQHFGASAGLPRSDIHRFISDRALEARIGRVHEELSSACVL